MKIATVRDFKTHATRYLHSREDVYVTRHGKTIAVVSPVPEKSVQSALLEMQRVLQESKLSKKEMLRLLDESRKEIYGQ
jgi:antitoxin (DNA-binding transcriptional repressor) of toxin-antitoxin stability system